jgi:WD40 repeat protein
MSQKERSPGVASPEAIKPEPVVLPEGVRLVAQLASGPVEALAFSPDGKLLATGSGALGAGGEVAAVAFWDAASGDKVRTLTARWRLFRGHREAISALAFSPDGRFLATGDATGGVIVWNVDSGKRRWWGCRVQGARILSLAFVQNGELLVVGSRRKLAAPMLTWTSYIEELGVRTARNGKLVRPLRPEYTVALAAPATGTHFATSGDGLLRLWKCDSSAPWSQIKGHESQVNALAFTPDGSLLASGGEDRAAKVWNPATGEIVATLRFSDGVKALAFSPQGKHLAILAHRLVVWDAATRNVRLSISGLSESRALAYCGDGKTLAVGGAEGAKIWSIAGLRG